MERKFDIVALGELNIDLILNRIAGFPEVGKEILADDCTMTLGSSTAIFAANAASLGSKVAFLGMVGRDDFGDFIEKSLRQRGVDTSMLIRSEERKSGITVVMNYGQDRANVTYPGAMSYLGIKEIEKAKLGEAKHVHISSLFLQERLKRDIERVIELLKNEGCTVSLDTQWDPEEKWDVNFRHILPLIDVFMPNEQELVALTHSASLEEAVAAVAGLVNVMVVKCGSKGSLLVTRSGLRRQIPALLNENPVDCIGAGDSFNAGFISGFVHGLELEECQDLGNLTGAMNTTAAGGTGAFASKESMDAAASLFGKKIKEF